MLGIGGIAMANLAGLLKQKGYNVSGSDSGVFDPSASTLKNLKIPYFNSYKSANLKKFKPDIVVIGNAISRGNEELEYILNEQIPYESMPETLKNKFVDGKKSIVITGTSGKTTTTALIAWILHFNKLSPTFLAGGVIKNLDSGFGYGPRYAKGYGKASKDQYVVLEGDEYNSSFYDACAKFIHYKPFIGIVNNIEQDHVDIYPTVEDIIKAFKRFVKLIPGNGSLILNKDNPNSAGLASFAHSKIKTFGAGGDISAKNISFKETGIEFEAYSGKNKLGKIKSRLFGSHNAENILAAILASMEAGLNFSKISKAIEKFKGVKRRLEIIYQNKTFKVIDDFGHNPEKVAASLSALRNHYPKHRLIAIFEPRTASSRRKIFQSKYVDSFKSADIIYIAEPYKKEDIAPAELFSHQRLVTALSKNGLKAHALATADDIVTHLANNYLHQKKPGVFRGSTSENPTIIVVMTSGDFDGIHQKILDLVKKYL